jgi:probable selenium-dependent hydroxylase accessory protein YqeC
MCGLGRTAGCGASLSSLLGIGAKSRVAVFGCGGKTSLIGILADENRDKKVLISPTTKIMPPAGEGIALLASRESAAAHRPAAGIQCMGVLDRATGKLKALPEEDMAALVPGYDVVLMEADGSRGLPCKGWNERDPVIPAFTTHSVGVLSIRALGLPADDDHVFRLPLFLDMTGLRQGDVITLQALAMMAVSPAGLMRRAAGCAMLVINQADDPDDMKNAAALASLIRQKNANIASVIVAGSAIRNTWQII